MYFSSTGKPVWNSLTEELRSADMPLRLWFSEMLPNMTSSFVDFRKSVQHRCLEPPADVAAGTAGSAFDYLIRYRLGRDDPAELAIIGSAMDPRTRDYTARIIELSTTLLEVACRWRAVNRSEMQPPPNILVQGCWILALFTELYRGVPYERSALRHVDLSRWGSSGVCPMPEFALEDLRQLFAAADKLLIPRLSERAGPVCVGPTFDAPIAADADLIKGYSLVELKASVGRRSRGRTPRYGLDARTLYQVVSYGLLGQRGFEIKELCIFNARYSHIYSWLLSDLLKTLAGKPVSARDLADELVAFLRDPCDRGVPASARLAALRIEESGESITTKRRRERFHVHSQ